MKYRVTMHLTLEELREWLPKQRREVDVRYPEDVSDEEPPEQAGAVCKNLDTGEIIWWLDDKEG